MNVFGELQTGWGLSSDVKLETGNYLREDWKSLCKRKLCHDACAERQNFVTLTMLSSIQFHGLEPFTISENQDRGNFSLFCSAEDFHVKL
jgi:hypothetical protein